MIGNHRKAIGGGEAARLNWTWKSANKPERETFVWNASYKNTFYLQFSLTMMLVHFIGSIFFFFFWYILILNKKHFIFLCINELNVFLWPLFLEKGANLPWTFLLPQDSPQRSPLIILKICPSNWTCSHHEWRACRLNDLKAKNVKFSKNEKM